IDDKPIIELIMDRLHAHGMKQFYVILNYKAAMIRSYFEETPLPYGVKFLEETAWLGTAGGLKLLPKRFPDTFLLTNCDVIVDAEYGDLWRFHRQNGFDMTIIVSCKHFVIPYGVCEIQNGGALRDIQEKPEYDLLVNTGVYLLNKNVIPLLPKKGACHMNELIKRAKAKGLKVGTYPVQEKSWADIGQWEEYHKVVRQLGDR
ncbi:MAG: nucleotidyltransferase, partial [Candidatus Omnitrophica bacterium]|nr:nucleotidyltransferase [Candidatus Omnitrophota bacterium]